MVDRKAGGGQALLQLLGREDLHEGHEAERSSDRCDVLEPRHAFSQADGAGDEDPARPEHVVYLGDHGLLVFQHVHWELLKRGAGVQMQVGNAEPSVRRALPTMEPFAFPVWFVAHRELRSSRRVRLVFDYLFDALSASPLVGVPSSGRR